jgi:hypothetical protein
MRRTVRTALLIAALFPSFVVLGCGRPSAGRSGEDAAASDAAAVASDPGRPAGAPAAGKWRAARPDRPPEQRAGAAATDTAATALLANPYLQGYRPARGGPTISNHDAARAWEGVNLYVSGHAAEAFLTDMSGRVLHRWRYDLERLWPDLYEGPGAAEIRRLEYWRRAALLPDGDLLAIYEGLGLVRLDRQSRLRWAYRGGAHHDLFVAADGAIWVLDRRLRRVPGIQRGEEILEDLVTVLGPDGQPRRQLSVVEAFVRSPYAPLLGKLEPGPDVLHTNTLEPLGAHARAVGLPAFRPGNLLLSVLKLDAVAVLDPRDETIVWALGGLWRRQHQPTLLASGRLLVFDNVGRDYRSRVLEVEPATQRVTWSWPAPASPEVLFSRTLGSVQRLPNGNTLVTESENGRAIEVTPDGDVVWEMRSPHRAGDEGELVATLFEVVRLPVAAGPPGWTPPLESHVE